MPDLFSPAGIAAWRTHLDASREFQAAAKGWSGSVLLREADDPRRATYLELTGGLIVEARPGTPSDAAAAEFVLAADATTWAALVAGHDELLPAAMRGALRLERGQVWRLLPHARAASALLRAAAQPGD